MAEDASSGLSPHPLRLFVAVDIPDDVRELVRRGVEPIRDRYPQGRWVPSVNHHVTLMFLGNVRPSAIAPTMDAIGEVAGAQAPFETRVRGLGAFPSARRARVLWIGLEDPTERLADLAAGLGEASAPDVVTQTRPFTPHLTVARFEPPVRLEQELSGLALQSRPFEVAWLSLYRSDLGRPTPRYEVLATFPFLGPFLGPLVG